MPFIKLAEIKFDDSQRIRQDLQEDGIQELIESIESLGLLQPIIINRENQLLAGRRRLEAVTRLKREEIEFRYFEDLDAIQQRIVEFDENSKRRNLTWQEESAAVAEIHTLLSSRSRTHTLGETAQMMGMSIGKASQLVSLSHTLDNEKIAKRPTKDGALKTMKRERELELARELARRRTFDTEGTPGFRYERLGQGIIWNEDCLAILRERPPDSVDLIVTDPPWGIGISNASQWTKKWVHSYDDSTSAVQSMMEKVIPELYRVLKPGQHIYIFYPIQDTGWWTDKLGAAGFTVRNRPLVWFKTDQPSMTDVYTSFLPCYESIIWGWKPGEGGFRRFFNRPIPEGFGLPRPSTEWHENEKPLALLQRFIEASSDPNDVILDPFAGGGSTLAAAFGIGRVYFGIEIDEVSHSKAVRRLRGLEEGSLDIGSS